MPVVFVVNSPKEATGLEEIGFTSGTIFIANTPEYPTVSAAARAAGEWLRVMGAVNIVPLGVDGPVTQPIQLLLKNLFGIELAAGLEEVWKGFIRDASLAFQV